MAHRVKFDEPVTSGHDMESPDLTKYPGSNYADWRKDDKLPPGARGMSESEINKYYASLRETDKLSPGSKAPGGSPDYDLVTKLADAFIKDREQQSGTRRREGATFDTYTQAENELKGLSQAGTGIDTSAFEIVILNRDPAIDGPGTGQVFQVQALTPAQTRDKKLGLATRFEVKEMIPASGSRDAVGGIFMYGPGFEDGALWKQIDIPPDVTVESLEVIEKPIPNTNRTNVTVLSNGRAIQNYSVEAEGKVSLQQTYSEALAAGAGIPPNRLEVGTTVVDGKQYFYPTIGEETFDADIVPIGDREFLQDRQGNLRELQKTYQPGTYYDATTDRFIARQPNGTIQILPRDYVPGVVEEADREFLVQPTGERRELARQFDPGFITDPDTGERLIQQPTGAVSQPRPVNMDEIITQALIDGDYDKAMAFQDFKNRPSAMEAFQAALNFARSPADQQLISSIARGEVTVEPPDPGLIRRVGPQPDFLVEEYNTFQQRLRAGRQPSQSEQAQYLQRHQEGRSPYSDQVDEANANLTSQLEDARSLARTQKEDFNRELGKFRNELIRLQSEPVGGNGGDAGGGGGAGSRVGSFNVGGDTLAGSGTQIYGRDVDSSAGIGAIRDLAMRWFGADRNGNMPDLQVLLPDMPEYEPGSRNFNVKSASFKDFKSWIIDAKNEGVTDAGLYGYLDEQLKAHEISQFQSDQTLRTMQAAGANNLSGAKISGAYNTANALSTGLGTLLAPDTSQESQKKEDIKNQGEIESTQPYSEVETREAFFRGGDWEDPSLLGAPESVTMADLYGMRDEIRDKRARQQRDKAEEARKKREAREAQVVPTRVPQPYVADPFEDSPTTPPGPYETANIFRGERDERVAPTSAPSNRIQSINREIESMGFSPSTSAVSASVDPRPRSRSGPPSYDEQQDEGYFFAKGGVTRGDNLEVVGEEGPELVDLPPGTHVIPFQQLNRRQLRQLQRDGVPGYAGGGVVFGSETLPLGLRQLQAGRQITPSRGYLSQQAGLTIPSVQAFQNLTPESRDIFRDTAMQAGIPARAFEQELALARPGGARLPLARFQPTTRRGIR